jgi:p-aminobenzoyl-glutamate transporter AbgT
MTPDLVAAAFRVADSSTNIITPMMIYSGVILAFMRKYRPGLGFGDMLLIMLPYSMAFLVVWTRCWSPSSCWESRWVLIFAQHSCCFLGFRR